LNIRLVHDHVVGGDRLPEWIGRVTRGGVVQRHLHRPTGDGRQARAPGSSRDLSAQRRIRRIADPARTEVIEFPAPDRHVVVEGRHFQGFLTNEIA
jgi:hypothetical protein